MQLAAIELCFAGPQWGEDTFLHERLFTVIIETDTYVTKNKAAVIDILFRSVFRAAGPNNDTLVCLQRPKHFRFPRALTRFTLRHWPIYIRRGAKGSSVVTDLVDRAQVM